MRYLSPAWMLNAAVFVIAGDSVFTVGQDVQAGRSSVAAASPELVDTGDSPIRIEKRPGWRGGNVVTYIKLTDENRVGYRLRNDSEKAVTAYALILTNGNDKSVRMAAYPERPVAAGKELTEGYLLSSTETPSWEFDWILFSDGSTWGPDLFGRSKDVPGFINGRKTAIDRAAALLVPSDPVMRSLRELELRSWSAGLSPTSADKRNEKYHFNAGYDTVVQSLLSDAERYKRENSKQIADRLKEMASEDAKP